MGNKCGGAKKKIHIVGSPELEIEGTPVYLDVEGLPDRDFYHLIGLRIGSGDTAVQHSLRHALEQQPCRARHQALRNASAYHQWSHN